jgi:DNA polymerase
VISEILQSAGYPGDTLVADFETYFDKDYSLKEMSTVEHIADGRFEFTGLGIKYNDNDPVFVGGDHAVRWLIRYLKRRCGDEFEKATVVVKNAKFDVLILLEKFGIRPKYVIDVEDLTRYYDSRMSQKLKDVAKLFKLKNKGDTSQFKGQHWEDMDHEAMKEYCLNDVELEYQILERMLPIIDDPAFEFQLMEHTLNLYLYPPFNLDVGLAKEISAGMQKELRKDLLEARWILKYATKKKKTISELLRAKSILPEILADVLPEGEEVPMKLSPKPYKKTGKHELIPALAKNDVGFQFLLVHPDKKVRDLCKAKAAMGSWPNHRTKVESIINQAASTNNKVRVPIKYYGAHTGRWSGMEGVNLLNLGGKGRGQAIHPLIGKARNALLAPEGHVLVIADSAQIEARELAWISGQDDLIGGFSRGEDIYSTFATRLFGEEVRKPRDSDTPGEAKILTIRRGFGKDAILGCGFGMGTNTFLLRCKQNPSLRPLFDSGEYNWDFIDTLIKTYRRTYARIPQFWKAIEKCFRWVTKYPNEVVTYCIPDDSVCLHKGMEKQKPIIKNAILTFWREKNDTIIQLPSGRRLFYRHAVVTRDKQLKYIWGPLWGGTLTENVIQAMCRDMLAGWLLECERNEIPIILHTYDELVGCVPEHRADEALAKMIEIMNTRPDWAAGLPLDTEGGISSCFKK